MPFVSITALSEMTGFHRGTIKRKLNGLKPRDGKYQAIEYDTLEALPILYAQEGSAYNTDKERARLLHHQANMAALDEQVKEKTLIPAEVVIQTWQGIFGNVRARLLSIPTALAATCANASREDVEEKASEMIREALEELVEVVEY